MIHTNMITRRFILASACAFAFGAGLQANDPVGLVPTDADSGNIAKRPHYSPYAGRHFPSPRWTAYDAKRFGLKVGPEVPITITERACTSPIWYTP